MATIADPFRDQNATSPEPKAELNSEIAKEADSHVLNILSVGQLRCSENFDGDSSTSHH